MNKNIRCGPETHIIPRMIARWELGRGTKRMDDSGIDSNLYDEICSEFILKIIAKHDYGSQQLCNKDPFTLRYMKERHPLKFSIWTIDTSQGPPLSLFIDYGP